MVHISSTKKIKKILNKFGFFLIEKFIFDIATNAFQNDYKRPLFLYLYVHLYFYRHTFGIINFLSFVHVS